MHYADAIFAATRSLMLRRFSPMMPLRRAMFFRLLMRRCRPCHFHTLDYVATLLRAAA